MASRTPFILHLSLAAKQVWSLVACEDFWSHRPPDRAISVASSSRAGTARAARARAAGGRVAARGRRRTAGGAVVHQFGDVADSRRAGCRCGGSRSPGFAMAGLADARFAMAARAGVVSRAAPIVSTAGQPHGCGTQDGAKADDSEALHFDSFRSVHGRDLRAPIKVFIVTFQRPAVCGGSQLRNDFRRVCQLTISSHCRRGMRTAS